MSVDRGMDKEDVTDYYSAIKRNEIMLFAATWKDLEIVILSCQTEKQKHHTTTLICGI